VNFKISYERDGSRTGIYNLYSFAYAVLIPDLNAYLSPFLSYTKWGHKYRYCTELLPIFFFYHHISIMCLTIVQTYSLFSNVYNNQQFTFTSSHFSNVSNNSTDLQCIFYYTDFQEKKNNLTSLEYLPG
jgi:hypothetical protein